MCAAHLEKGEHCIVFDDNNVFTSGAANYKHYAANHERRIGRKPVFELTPGDFDKVQPSANEIKDLNEMTVKELKAFAKENEIELNGAKSKDDILAAIEAVTEEALQEGNPETPEA